MTDPAAAQDLPPAEGAGPGSPCPKHPKAPILGTCQRCGSFFCLHCKGQQAGLCAECEERTREAPKLRGWMLVAPFFVLWPILSLVFLIVSLVLGLMVPGNRFDPNPLFLWNVSVSTTLSALGITTVVLYLRKKKISRRLMIGFFASLFVAAVVNFVIKEVVQPSGKPVTLLSLPIAQLSIFALWINYFTKDSKVRQTLTR
ncbi:MAG TPA: hypothetical protein VGK67_02520 [Myxococcales bacterium]|jgi:energy-converting hydrogenase Eha subunit A